MENKDLTQGSIIKTLWSLAWPMMLTMFFYNLYNLVDTYWVSSISEEAFTAVGVSQITLIVMISLGFGITAGSGVIMAMNIGAKNKPEAERVLGQSFVLSAMLAVLFTAVALIFCDQILLNSGAAGDIFDPAKEYFIIVSSGSILLFLMMSVMFAFMSQGDTTTLTKLFAVSIGINVILDPLFINGYGPIEAMGISGAAYATLVSQAVFLFISIRLLMKPKMNIRFQFKNLTFRLDSVKQVLKIGFPAALTQVIFPIGLLLFANMVLEGFGEQGSAAFALGLRIEFFAYLPASGFGFAAMAMIGQSMGAGNLERARKTFLKAARIAFLSAAGIGLVTAFFANGIVQVFTDSETVATYFRSYVWIVGLSYGFLAAMMVQASAFQSFNKSWPGFWIYLLRVAVISVPLCYVLVFVFDLDIWSMWIAMVAGNVISAIVGQIWINSKIKQMAVEMAEAAKNAEVDTEKTEDLVMEE